MDIDAARRKGGVPPSVCRCCGKAGHWAHSCLKGLDVRYLSANKWDALIMELLAAKDAAGVPSPKVADRTLEDGEEVVLEDGEEVVLEDFWYCSGWTICLHCLVPTILHVCL